MTRVILWDVDGTLLDFHEPERVAIRALFGRFGLGECTEEMLQRYSAVNRRYWARMEQGELTKQQVLLGRFEEFFTSLGIDPAIAPAFNDAYQLSLGDTIVFRDDSLEIVRALRGKVRQYVVSNGTVAAQTKKLRLSGLGELMDGVFLSEQLGAEKPSPDFFDRVFAAIGPVERSEVLIVGDSIGSDIRGGTRAGIRTCWYDPDGAAEAPEDVRVDHCITHLSQVFDLL